MPQFKLALVLDSGARIGPGKVTLLESIAATGSISAGARAMGMSYKRAWQLVDHLNSAFDEPVVMTSPGGRGGGGAKLSPWGEELLRRWQAIVRSVDAATAADVAALAARARPDVPEGEDG